MKTQTLLRASLLIAAASAALSAQAVTIGLESVGTLSAESGTGFVAFAETVNDQLGGLAPLGSLTMSLNILLESGFGTYTGANPADKLFFDFELPNVNYVNVNGYQAASGSWIAVGGTGAYQNATGQGVLANVVDIQDAPTGLVGPSYTTFRGDIQAVPEPATMLAVGVGTLGVLRRRKTA